MAIEANLNEHSVILFDGFCNLCNRTVQSIIKRDKQGSFRFASLQSNTAQVLLGSYNSDLEEVDSIILVTKGGVYLRSDAALKISSSLDGYFPCLSILRVIPKPMRDAMYDWIARNRYRWFGKREVCMLPSPELESRFLS